FAWYSENSGNRTHAVGTKLPNKWGLYDMLGNVWEWCADWYGPYQSASATNPKGPSSGSSHVARGGSWENTTKGCRPAQKLAADTPDKRGFRPAKSLP